MPSKVNFAMRKRAKYDVALQPDGSAETTLGLDYANTGRLAVTERGVFRNYLRVYRAPGTVAAKGDQTTEGVSGHRGRGSAEGDPRVLCADAGRSTPRPSRRRCPARGGRKAQRKTIRSKAAARQLSALRGEASRPGGDSDERSRRRTSRLAGQRVCAAGRRRRGSGYPRNRMGRPLSLAVPLDGDLILDVDLVRE